MGNHERFIVSFIANGQPDSRVLEADSETLSVDEAEALLRISFSELKSAELSDIQVQKRTRPTEEEHGVPGHFKQP
ncbi:MULTISPECIES: hypothetical protein [unclassified Pseudomonas]|jgi:hypothetical protein|uniref:hypothetical protein n=1 Tax=unclassified Pseudomonas TaxID=196821 RepID=UPI0008765A73|nr:MULTISPECIES: hypothetical protein [unclassified Pseudomonas]MDB6444870.1 hypothetical protein [Pseudomonas sp. 21TX0197]ROO36675.1 hypothetical protein BIV08_03930 [Pseudomonas sp. AF76]SCX51495.1 hypothetical protein SAMN03159507_01252 [Pseudomonas sp. NFACC32-1]SFW90078.1 hypothetical protein SAMN03159376_05188 [Pseudomonas sp. NFACC09-4]SFX22572.1 hypothetical protein SAMN03159390_00820 [Pseudomonas sp. NFACC49-2]